MNTKPSTCVGLAVALFCLVESVQSQQSVRIVPQVGHSSSVSNLAWSKSKKLVASTSSDNTAKIWLGETGELIQSLRFRNETVRSISNGLSCCDFDPTDNYIALGGSIGSGVFHIPTGSMIQRLDPINYTTDCIAYSSDGKLICTGGVNNLGHSVLRLWDVASFEPTQIKEFSLGNTRGCNCIVFVENQNLLICGFEDGAILSFSILNDRNVEPLFKLPQHPKGIAKLELAESGDNLYSIGHSQIRKWNLNTKTLNSILLDHRSPTTCVDIAPNKRWLATGHADNVIRVWSAQTGEVCFFFPLFDSHATDLRFKDDSKNLHIGFYDGSSAQIDIISGAVNPTLKADQELGSVHFILRSGASVSGTTTSKGVIYRDTETTSQLTEEDVSLVAFSPNRDYFLSINQEEAKVKVWSVADPLPKLSYQFAIDIGELRVDAATICNSGSTIAIGLDGEMRVYSQDKASPTVKKIKDGTRIKDLAFSWNSKFLASAEGEKVVVFKLPLLDALECDFEVADISSIKFATDDTVLAFGCDYSYSGLQCGVLDLKSKKTIVKAVESEEKKPWGIGTILSAKQKGLWVTQGNQSDLVFWDPDCHQAVSVLPTLERGLGGTSTQSPTAISAEKEGQIVLGYWNGDIESINTNSPEADRLKFAQRHQFKDGGLLPKSSVLEFSTDLTEMYTSNGNDLLEWDLSNGKISRTFQGHEGRIADFALSEDDSTFVTTSEDGSVKVWDARTGICTNTIGFDGERGGAVDIHTDHMIIAWNQRVAVYGRNPVDKQLDFSKVILEKKVVELGFITEVKLCNNEKEFLVSDEGGFVGRWEIKTGKCLKRYPSPVDGAYAMALDVVSQSSSKFATSYGNAFSEVNLFSIENVKPIKRFEGHKSFTHFVDFDPSGRLLFSGSSDETARVWDIGTGQEQVFEHPAIPIVGKFVNSQVLATYSSDGVVRFWSAENDETPEISAFNRAKLNFLTVDRQGRFDGNNLNSDQDFRWVASDDPYRPLSPEIFSRDYFEPNLFGRLLAGEAIPIPREKVVDLNRVQPEIRKPIVKIVGDTASVKLRVKAIGNQDTFGIAPNEKKAFSDAFDLRLFRDGQLVWQHPSPDKDSNLELSIENDEQLEEWRAAYKIASKERNNLMRATGDGWYEHTLTIPLARHRPADMRVEFSTYCFNKDRVKSKTRSTTKPLKKSEGKVERKAYIICMGVNASENRELDLRFANDDAKAIQHELGKALGKEFVIFPKGCTLTAQYDGKRSEGLVDRSKVTATKRNLRTALALLSGGNPTDEELNELPEEFRKLPKCTPDDVVIIYASTHGFTDPKTGMFYLFPYDVGANGMGPKNTVLKNCISSSELSRWLRDVDAAQHVLILDTCMSEGAVKSAGSEFKPGPFGSRGLGQLAYDKAMIVLAASQSDECAISHKKLKHGLLTYTLLQGLGALEGQQESPITSRYKEELSLARLFQYAVDETENVHAAANAEGSKFATINEPWKQESKDELGKNWGTFARSVSSTQKPVLYNYSNRKILLNRQSLRRK